MSHEKRAQLDVLLKVACKCPRGGNGCRHVVFTHLHVPEGKGRFCLNKEVAAATGDDVAHGEKATFLVAAAEEPANTPGNARADDVIDPRAGDARANMLRPYGFAPASRAVRRSVAVRRDRRGKGCRMPPDRVSAAPVSRWRLGACPGRRLTPSVMRPNH